MDTELFRKQKAVCHCDSEILNVSCGLPHISILRPKLFTMYINDICKVSQVFMYFYLPTIQIYCIVIELNELVRTINGGLEQLQT